MKHSAMLVHMVFKILSKNLPLGRFLHGVAMSVCLFVPFPCNFFLGLSFALKSHDQIPALLDENSSITCNFLMMALRSHDQIPALLDENSSIMCNLLMKLIKKCVPGGRLSSMRTRPSRAIS